jgi:GT2 family glycosyltransferase
MPGNLTPAVSVIIVSWNSRPYLARCIKGLTQQTFRDFEVIVIDNASDDGSTSELPAEGPGLMLSLTRLPTNRGFAAASNAGARQARGKWLALLNPDAFPETRWLQELVEATRSFPEAFFASRQLQAGNPGLLDGEGDIYFSSGLALRRGYGRPVPVSEVEREVFSACAAAALYPRHAFLDAGGFDEDYFAYHEDVDLGFRLRLRGLRCVLVPKAIVHHVGTGSSGSDRDFAIYHGHRNLVWTFLKDMPSPWFWIDLPLHVLMNLISIAYFSVKGNGRAILRAKLHALAGAPAALAKRHKIQRERRIPVSEIRHHITSNPLGPLQGWWARRRSAATSHS